MSTQLNTLIQNRRKLEQADLVLREKLAWANDIMYKMSNGKPLTNKEHHTLKEINELAYELESWDLI